MYNNNDIKRKRLENRMKKNWQDSKRIVEELFALEALKNSDIPQIKRILKNWLYFFSVQKNQILKKEVECLLDKV